MLTYLEYSSYPKNQIYRKNKTHPAHEYTVLDIEQHMSNKHIGQLVTNFMKKNDGAPLLIVFPEYDNGDDDDKNTCCIK